MAVKSMSVSVTVNGPSTLSGSMLSTSILVVFVLLDLHVFSGRMDFWKRCVKKKPTVKE